MINPLLLLDQARVLPGVHGTVSTGHERIHLRHHTNDSWILIEVLYKEIYKGIPFDQPIIDVGAHIGAFLLWVRRYHATVPVTCVEPDPHNFDYLLDNIAENDLFFVEVIEKALGDKNEKLITLRGADHRGAEWSKYGQGTQKRTVQTVTLQDLTAGLSGCTLKMDAEGAENTLITSPVPKAVTYIVMEYHKKYVDFDKLDRRLLHLGFRVALHKTEGESGIIHYTRRP